MSKKIQVSFTERQHDLLTQLRGEFGETDADVVRGIVLSWLAEKSFISTIVKKRMNAATVDEVANEKEE